LAGSRSALLIRCSTQEAAKIRDHAQRERRTISGYLLVKIMRAVQTEEILFARLSHFQKLTWTLPRTPTRSLGPRAALLLRCSADEAAQIRVASRRRQTTISGFVVDVLVRTWQVGENFWTAPG